MTDRGTLNTGELVIAAIAGYVDRPAAGIGPGDTTQALGIDSLDIVELVIDLEDQLGFEIDEEKVLAEVTVGGIVAAINSQAANPHRRPRQRNNRTGATHHGRQGKIDEQS